MKLRRRPKPPKNHISFLVPLGGDDPVRLRNWEWLKEYYKFHLPGVEIVMGRDKASKPSRLHPRRPPLAFSKAAAVNDAFKRSHGDIIVILDADAYLQASVIKEVAFRLRLERKAGVRSWFVPYHFLYRLTRPATNALLESPPFDPFQFPTPPYPDSIDNKDGSGPINIFAAMCNIMPREAFVAAGGMDPRFRGWGSEDYAFARALDTLWGPRQYTSNDILHLWHPHFISGQGKSWVTKMWPHQNKPGINNELGFRYLHAESDPVVMQALVDEHKNL